tara:strand:- start:45 stop:1412 length:1368 start_codon:yes stop_codon:yes gene_type:complete
MFTEESLKFNKFEIESNIDGKIIDLRAGSPVFEYRESVFSPYIEITTHLVDTGNTVEKDDGDGSAIGLLEAGYCQGTEVVRFNIEDRFKRQINLTKDSDLRLASVTSAKQSFQNQTFTITAVGKEAFDNTLIDNRCRRQYSGKISDIALRIIKEDLKSAKWGGTFVDVTDNEYHEYGQDRYPFEMLLDLQKLAIPNIQTSDGKRATGQTAGYLFWQTWDRYHFRSLDKLFDVTDKQIRKFIENKKSGDAIPKGYDAKILYSEMFRSTDALAEFESGGRGSLIQVYNEVTKEFTNHPLASIGTGNGITGGRHLPKLHSDYEGKFTTRQVTRAAVGQTVKGHETIEMQVEKTAQPNYEVQNIFQQAHQSYRQKMNVSLEVMIAADLSLRAGDLIYCEFEDMTTSRTVRGSKKRDSGIYMIADLCHYGDVTKAFTGLNLVRDAYGAKSLEGSAKSLSS